MRPCPICGDVGGFHHEQDHGNVPRDRLLAKDWHKQPRAK